jgi:hypothetical protein
MAVGGGPSSLACPASAVVSGLGSGSTSFMNWALTIFFSISAGKGLGCE